ncbi:MAG: glycoside hydrolase family 32 protein [Muribaculaceae bacterium]|nr:glycoside hydrolase family 32 protein [Muribaculaceae bacterium]
MRNIHLAILLTFISINFGFSQRFDSLPPATYKELYRPQYHYTPGHRWMGDPSGLLKFNGKYRAYNWGASESDDLIYWKELNSHSIKGMPQNISAFTGSTVVDKDNTSGYGENSVIAVFTVFDKESKKQAQGIAYSSDEGETFHYFDRNPVLDIWSTEFRDPTVIFDQQSEQWIMVVAKALEKKVAFYGSKDLREWKWLSDFGPLGDSDRSWECPDIFQLPVDGDRENMKWILVVSVNWDREQYFIGNFDGEKFVADEPDQYPLYIDQGLDYYASRVFQDYDTKDAPVYTIGWVCKWDYAQTQPSEWGKGIWSIPREYSLRTTADGLRLFQSPLPALVNLRKNPYSFSKTLKTGVTELKPLEKYNNTYELEVEFSQNDSSTFGLYLCEGENRKLSLSYDPASQYITLDRTNVTNAEIPKFERTAISKVPMENGKLLLNIFVDKSTVEVFVNNGAAVLTALTYPSESQNGVSIFTLGNSTKVRLNAWELNSIW